MTPVPTVRLIARESGYSVATVSEALRGSGRVKSSTREAICRVAREMGYRHNPIVGQVMSHMRLSSTSHYCGMVAVLEDAAFKASRKASAWHKALFTGVTKRLDETGFTLEFHAIDTYARRFGRLSDVLECRGAKGLIIPPFARHADFDGFDWASFPVVQFDYTLKHQRMTTILPDHHMNMGKVFAFLSGLGYRRPGLVLESNRDERIHHKLSASFRAFQFAYSRLELPVYITPGLQKDGFLNWFQEARPDVVIGHDCRIVEWLERSLSTTGFFSLNVHEADVPVAGLNLLPEKLGSGAVDSLVSMILRHETGIPETAQSIMLEGVIQEGPTVRRQAPVAGYEKSAVPGDGA